MKLTSSTFNKPIFGVSDSSSLLLNNVEITVNDDNNKPTLSDGIISMNGDELCLKEVTISKLTRLTTPLITVSSCNKFALQGTNIFSEIEGEIETGLISLGKDIYKNV